MYFIEIFANVWYLNENKEYLRQSKKFFYL